MMPGLAALSFLTPGSLSALGRVWRGVRRLLGFGDEAQQLRAAESLLSNLGDSKHLPQSPLVVNIGTGDSGNSMILERLIKHGESIDDLIHEVKGLTFQTGNEHAIVRLAVGKLAIQEERLSAVEDIKNQRQTALRGGGDIREGIIPQTTSSINEIESRRDWALDAIESARRHALAAIARATGDWSNLDDLYDALQRVERYRGSYAGQ